MNGYPLPRSPGMNVPRPLPLPMNIVVPVPAIVGPYNPMLLVLRPAPGIYGLRRVDTCSNKIGMCLNQTFPQFFDWKSVTGSRKLTPLTHPKIYS